MALFSSLAYRNDLPLRERHTRGCEDSKREVGAPAQEMPSSVDGTSWSRWVGNDEEDRQLACHSDLGLFYETYIRIRPSGVAQAVIAFRGTENRPAAAGFVDWVSNILPTFGIEPEQFSIAKEKVPRLISALNTRFGGNIEIYTTGHSLGGALAQQAAYQSTLVRAAYVFNTSPKTNWARLAEYYAGSENIPNRYPTIYRVAHDGEALQAIRDITTRFNTRRLNRSDYEFRFQDVGAIGGHSIALLAENLANNIQGSEADFGFSKDSAQRLSKQIAKKSGAELNE